MKGIVLAGGAGTRLHPLTLATSKQLLPVYDKPMLFYPIESLLAGGITDILVVVAPDRLIDFQRLFEGNIFPQANFSFVVQEKPAGIAQALILGEDFLSGDAVTLILGDNIFEYNFSEAIKNFRSGAHIFAKEVENPERFGVVEFDKEGSIIKIIEKPKEFISSFAVTGIYIFDANASKIAKSITPSARGELEIVDVINSYLNEGSLRHGVIDGKWLDAGTFESLLEAGTWARERSKRSGALS